MLKLRQRVGDWAAARLMALKATESRNHALGLTDTNQPSQADFEIRRALMRSEFTPEERERIREAIGIDAVAETEIPVTVKPDVPVVSDPITGVAHEFDVSGYCMSCPAFFGSLATKPGLTCPLPSASSPA